MVFCFSGKGAFLFFLLVYYSIPLFPFLLCFQCNVDGKLDFGFLCIRCILSPVLPLAPILDNLTLRNFSFVLLIFLVLEGHRLLTSLCL